MPTNDNMSSRYTPTSETSDSSLANINIVRKRKTEPCVRKCSVQLRTSIACLCLCVCNVCSVGVYMCVGCVLARGCIEFPQFHYDRGLTQSLGCNIPLISLVGYFSIFRLSSPKLSVTQSYCWESKAKDHNINPNPYPKGSHIYTFAVTRIRATKSVSVQNILSLSFALINEGVFQMSSKNPSQQKVQFSCLHFLTLHRSQKSVTNEEVYFLHRRFCNFQI